MFWNWETFVQIVIRCWLTEPYNTFLTSWTVLLLLDNAATNIVWAKYYSCTICSREPIHNCASTAWNPCCLSCLLLLIYKHHGSWPDFVRCHDYAAIWQKQKQTNLSTDKTVGTPGSREWYHGLWNKWQGRGLHHLTWEAMSVYVLTLRYQSPACR